MEQCDRQIDSLHRDRPPNVPLYLRSTECEARNLDAFTRDSPSILKAMVLPMGDGRNYWPLPRNFNSAIFAPQPFNPNFSSDWGLVKEQQARERSEQQQQQATKQEAEACERQAANGTGTVWW
jgi:hypothetical protein